MSNQTFQVGEIYGTRSACNYETIFWFKVMRRTEKSVWVCRVQNGEVCEAETKRRSILKFEGRPESIYPLGQYSMAPVLTPTEP